MPLPPWTPDLPALDLLLSVAELGSVGRAAQAHSISQPSASARLARLERRLGVSLLVRTSRGSSLTPAGEAVVAWARGVVNAAQDLTDGVSTLRAGRRARLRAAASLTIAEYLMPQWLLILRRRHPGLDIAVTVANSHAVCARVRSGRADIGFIEAPSVPPDLSNRSVGQDRLALVVARDYPLASRAVTGIRPRDLLDQPILLREAGSGTRDTFLHALARAIRVKDPYLPHATELGSTTTILATARAGGGIGVVSTRAVAGEIANGQLVELNVAGLDLRRRLHAVWTGRAPTDLGRELVEIARSRLAEPVLQPPGRERD
ncbi:MAG TPA: LysR family transcriptional regulator [Pedococcus sp.]|jgi:DNA-binding transcriptional LysR family regulator|nr:LysR family transcriptional regulator [Pedococcus sp.]